MVRTSPRVVVSYDLSDPDGQLARQAGNLARELDLQLFDPEAGQAVPAHRFLLTVTGNGLEIRINDPVAAAPVRVDFDNPAFGYRLDDKVARQAIARAAGVRPGLTPLVLDCTAGLCRDAFLLASLGCKVTALERDPVIHALAGDGLLRGLKSPSSRTRETAALVRLIRTDFMAWQLAGRKPDAVLLDPMFPLRRGSARVKKEMYLLQRFLEERNSQDEDARLLGKALETASHRVVVKRPRAAPFVDARKPTFQLTGRSSRFDVYITG